MPPPVPSPTSPGLPASECLHAPRAPNPLSSSPAPAEDIARLILGEDVTQIEYYTERVKRMVGRVLNGNAITELQQGRYRLIGSAAVRLLRSSRAERHGAR